MDELQGLGAGIPQPLNQAAAAILKTEWLSTLNATAEVPDRR